MPLGRRILLWIDPFPTLGNEASRTESVPETGRMLRRWSMAAMVLFLCAEGAGVLAEGSSLFAVVEATAAFATCIALAVCAVLGAVYLQIGSR